MRSVDYDYMFEIEERFWWYVGMRHVVDTILADALQQRPLTILDAGCGTGMNFVHFQNAGIRMFGLDLAPEAISHATLRGIRNIARASVTDIPYASSTFDIVYSFEVVDEVPDSDRAIAELFRVLKPGGHLLLRLPAFEWLRSSHDVDIGTVHRYRLEELNEKLRRAGFTIVFSTYANTMLFPFVVVRRFLKRFGFGTGTDTKPLPAGLRWIDPVLRTILSSEASLFRRRRSLPFGLSAISFAQRIPVSQK